MAVSSIQLNEAKQLTITVYPNQLVYEFQTGDDYPYSIHTVIVSKAKDESFTFPESRVESSHSHKFLLVDIIKKEKEDDSADSSE